MRFGLRGGDNVDLYQSQLECDGENEQGYLSSNAKILPKILEQVPDEDHPTTPAISVSPNSNAKKSKR